ncbi:MAG TPA: hypothetical protein VK213_14210 [Bacteroidales bacterium]|nr:hypothetical protein [Bacteroidales bacterium]
MLTWLLVYLGFGIIMNLAGPLAVQIRTEMKDLRRQTVPVHEVRSRRHKLLIAEIIFRALVLLLFPFAYLLWVIDIFRSKKETAARNQKHSRINAEIEKLMERKKWEIIENRSFIYYRDTHGEGTIKCHGCGFREEIVGFTGVADSKQLSRGYQCQKCGRFHSVKFLGSRMITPFLKCSCGGELSNVNPIFCPRCKTRDVCFVCECYI